MREILALLLIVVSLNVWGDFKQQKNDLEKLEQANIRIDYLTECFTKQQEEIQFLKSQLKGQNEVIYKYEIVLDKVMEHAISEGLSLEN